MVTSSSTAPTRFARFCEAADRSFVPLNIRCDSPQGFRGSVVTHTADGITLSRIAATAHAVSRTPELIDRSPRRSYKLSLMTRGRAVLEQSGRRVSVEQGDLVLYDTDVPYSLTFTDTFRAVVLMFEQGSTDLPAELGRQMAAVRLPREDAAVRPFAAFLGQLAQDSAQMDSPLGARLAHAAVDLASTMIATEAADAGLVTDPELHRAHLFIAERLADPELTPTRVADGLHLSVRHLHEVFAKSGSTVSSWTRDRRFELSRRLLRDPLFAERSITEIALRCGIPDPARFSRTFRELYGTSPSLYRVGG